MGPFDAVKAFEERVAEYAGAPYGVAVNSCTNALLLSFMYHGGDEVVLPKKTYVGVAQSALNAGYKIEFVDLLWEGAYSIIGTKTIDSARRFRKDMYVSGFLYCLSFHHGKHLPIGRGGMILTDDIDACQALKKMRYDGRREGVPPKADEFIRGYHCYMHPEDAVRGLMLMGYIKDDNPDIPADDYPDLSKQEVFRASNS